jgi:F-type H+-transporting ATPase subunit delta
MIEGRLSRRYARALFNLAREGGEEEKIGRELQQFFATYEGSDLPKILVNPAFSGSVRKTILNRVTGALHLSQLTTNFLSLLLERDRVTELPGIVSVYGRLLDQSKGRVEARILSAAALDAVLVDQLRDRLRALAGKDVVLRQEIEPSLLGGLSIELEGKVYDGSLSGQLEKLKQRIARGH